MGRPGWSVRRAGRLLGLALAGLLGLAACTEGDPQVTVGRQFAMERTVAVKKGSSKREVEDLLGPPWRVTRLDDRREQWRYYARVETPQRILLVIPDKTRIQELELTLVFEGNFVEIIDKSTTHYAEE